MVCFDSGLEFARRFTQLRAESGVVEVDVKVDMYDAADFEDKSLRRRWILLGLIVHHEPSLRRVADGTLRPHDRVN